MTADQDRDRPFDKKGEHAEGVREVKGATKLLQSGQAGRCLQEQFGCAERPSSSSRSRANF
ncbi:hypothetical protein [Sphingomonas sp.]|uniref:hypothetical protein n=1 Tax=Sphingomonas sp. TaxID=28214 RepID=UPI000A46E877